MKLLIVDDEEITRKGLIQKIDWHSLNITEIFDADDGIHGLAKAKEIVPNIILSDIRMPRMNGIEMAIEIRKLFPDTSIIFMSGFSDKEYLKAAIQLKAISYVEKPLNPLDIEDAILSAIENNERLQHSKYVNHLFSNATASKLALLLTQPKELLDSKSEHLFTMQANQNTNSSNIAIEKNHYFTTIIIKFTKSLGDLPEDYFLHIHTIFKDFLAHYSLDELHLIKHDHHLVYHIYGKNSPSNRILSRICEYIQGLFSKGTPFFIAIGETVKGPEQCYRSYQSAVILLQSSFFYEYNSILFSKEKQEQYAPAFQDPSRNYLEVLLSKTASSIYAFENNLYETFTHSNTLLPNKVKDTYYKLFMTIQNAYRKLSLNFEDSFSSSEIILEYLEECHTLTELHSLLTKRSKGFLKSIEQQKTESQPILAIKEYIANNYKRENLSVLEISEYIHMSSSYVCTVFKSETGQTLNQYITYYRIEKAKHLLTDSGYQIAQIAEKVGYADGNYFSKIFRKQVGLSPSEYREKTIFN